MAVAAKSSKKKKAKRRSRYTPEEPSIDNWSFLSEEEQVAAIAGWPQLYRDFFTAPQLKDFYLEWANEYIGSALVPAVKAGMPIVTHLHGSWARMIQAGYYTQYYQDALYRKTEDVVAYGEKVIAEKKLEAESAQNFYKPSAEEVSAEIIGALLGIVSGEIDEFIESKCKVKKTKFCMLDFLRAKEVKSAHALLLRIRVGDMLDEICEVLEGKDDQLNEGWSFMSKAQQKKYRTFLKTMETEAVEYVDGLKLARTPRTKKVKTPEQLTAKVLYKSQHEPLGLTSISPTKLIDANEVWLYNTKDRFLHKYVSHRGISVRGSTLYDWDVEKSFKKKLRKPEDVLHELLGAGRVKLRKFMGVIKAKESKVTGRINKDTIIMRVE